MSLNAIFECWTVEDGSYPPLSVGDKVNLSFELKVGHITAGQDRPSFAHLSRADYSFCGVVRAYYDDPEPTIAIDAGGVRFFCEGDKVMGLSPGTYVRGEGTLYVDYYGWVEYLTDRAGAPDLFGNFVVARIAVPEIPVQPTDAKWDGSTVAAAEESNDLRDVRSTDCSTSHTFILYLEATDESVSRTFR